MFSYEVLDAIADKINPALLGVSLILPWMPGVKPRVPPGRWLAMIASAASVVDGLQYLDKTCDIWSRWHDDYSTHSAAAIALVTLWSFASMAWFGAGLIIYVSYAALMVYQRYHSWHDILST